MKTQAYLFVIAIGLANAVHVKQTEELVDYRVELIEANIKPTDTNNVPFKLDEDVLPTTIDNPVLSKEEKPVFPIKGKSVTCTKGGVQICSDCRTISSCIDYGNGTIAAETTGICDQPGSHCLNGTCSTATNPQCDGTTSITFQCTNLGKFPDPFDCHQYHFCTPTPIENAVYHFTATCEVNYTYNAVTGFCDTHITKATNCNSVTAPTTFPIPLCNTAKPFGGVIGASMYYICKPFTIQSTGKVVLYPYIYVCPRGGTYNGSGSCTPPASSVAAAPSSG